MSSITRRDHSTSGEYGFDRPGFGGGREVSGHCDSKPAGGQTGANPCPALSKTRDLLMGGELETVGGTGRNRVIVTESLWLRSGAQSGLSE